MDEDFSPLFPLKVTPQRLRKQLAGPLLQFASSDSSEESEIAKAESMSRTNHLHDEMRWRAVGMLQAGERQSAVARELMHRSPCGNLTTVIPRKGKVELSSPPPQGFILRFLLTLPPSGCRI
ncbi:hypothetical protein AVEN_171649-1 [Araneus ventricosus]|uniref:Uncharacterized protein n=1 Tax=Araneus ventricosus TaxID=182803 RepID=A0A4Y2EZE6_ARAVE|nr:hypothetical protein AVEN_171649-1 [Araneus ventricosus]